MDFSHCKKHHNQLIYLSFFLKSIELGYVQYTDLQGIVLDYAKYPDHCCEKHTRGHMTTPQNKTTTFLQSCVSKEPKPLLPLHLSHNS